MQRFLSFPIFILVITAYFGDVDIAYADFSIKIEKGSGKPNVDKVGKITREQLKAIAEKKLDFEALYAFFRVTPETAIENLSSSLNEVFEVHNATTGGTLDDARYMIWLGKCFFFHEDEY